MNTLLGPGITGPTHNTVFVAGSVCGVVVSINGPTQIIVTPFRGVGVGGVW